MRAGAGYVTARVPASLQPVFEREAARGDDARAARRRDGRLRPGAASSRCSRRPARGGALVLGPGLGRSDDARRVRPRARARGSRCRSLLDADGLNAHAGRARGARRAATRRPSSRRTPASWGGCSEIDSRRGRARGGCATRARPPRARGAIVVLKGDDTLVAEPGRRASASARGGAPALATAGTGDVLVGRDRRAAGQGHATRSPPPARGVHAARARRAAAARAARRRTA